MSIVSLRGRLEMGLVVIELIHRRLAFFRLRDHNSKLLAWVSTFGELSFYPAVIYGVRFACRLPLIDSYLRCINRFFFSDNSQEDIFGAPGLGRHAELRPRVPEASSVVTRLHK